MLVNPAAISLVSAYFAFRIRRFTAFSSVSIVVAVRSGTLVDLEPRICGEMWLEPFLFYLYNSKPLSE